MPVYRILFYPLLVVLSAICGPAYAADTLLVSQLQPSTPGCSLKQLEWSETDRHLTYDQAARLTFAPCGTISVRSNQAYWARGSLKNDLDNDTVVYFYSRNHLVYLFRTDQTGNTDTLTGGAFATSSQVAHPYCPYAIPLRIKRRQTLSFYLQTFNLHEQEPVIDFLILTNEQFQKDSVTMYRQTLTSAIITISFTASLFLLFLITLFAFSQSRQPIFLSYSLYLLGNVIYGCIHLPEITLIGTWLKEVPGLRIYLNYPIQFVCFAAYSLFAIDLLNIRDHDRFLYRAMRLLIFVYLAAAVAQFTLTLFTFHTGIRNYIFIISRAILIPINIYLVIRAAYTIRTPVFKYFLVGVSIYLIAALLAAYRVIIDENMVILDGTLTSTNIFQLGILIEIICFAFAVGFKIRMMDISRQASEQAYIGELKKQLDTEKRLAEVEASALRSQMNPHFIFNSMNAIRFLIMSHKNQEAVTYLNRFSKLIRLILEYAQQNQITLEQELTALDLYLGIESTRFDDSFSYRIDVAGDVDTSQILIPPLLLQPFAENAVWHGLLPKKESDKTLLIDVRTDDDGYVIRVEDNGIGRAAAGRLRKTKNDHHTSMGTRITCERVELFNLAQRSDISIIYEDAASGGTIVMIRYKL